VSDVSRALEETSTTHEAMKMGKKVGKRGSQKAKKTKKKQKFK
jgi:hypothetical protein